MDQKENMNKRKFPSFQLLLVFLIGAIFVSGVINSRTPRQTQPTVIDAGEVTVPANKYFTIEDIEQQWGENPYALKENACSGNVAIIGYITEIDPAGKSIILAAKEGSKDTEESNTFTITVSIDVTNNAELRKSLMSVKIGDFVVAKGNLSILNDKSRTLTCKVLELYQDG